MLVCRVCTCVLRVCVSVCECVFVHVCVNICSNNLRSASHSMTKGPASG